MVKKVFRSRVSVFHLFVVFVFFLGFCLLLGNWVGFVIVGALIVLVFFDFRSYYFVLTDKEIQTYYQWGLWGKPYGKIHISAIISVERGHSFIGCTIKTLRFRFKKGYKWRAVFPTPITPVREQEFLETLKEINPNIQFNVNDKKGFWRFLVWDF